jgi:hypothetical protein
VAAEGNMPMQASETPVPKPEVSRPQKTNSGELAEPKEVAQESTAGEIYGMVLTIRNRVNNSYVTRPDHLKAEDRWAVEYTVEDIEDERARRLYEQVLARRRKALQPDENREELWYGMWGGRLQRMSDFGRKFRSRETRRAKSNPVYVYGEKGSRTYEDVFGPDEDEDDNAVDDMEGKAKKNEKRW